MADALSPVSDADGRVASKQSTSSSSFWPEANFSHSELPRASRSEYDMGAAEAESGLAGSVRQRFKGYNQQKIGRKMLSATSIAFLNKLDAMLQMEDDRFSELFKALDADGSGEVTQHELYNSMRALGMDVSLEEVEDLFSSLDPDGSGGISFDELKALLLKTKMDDPAAKAASAPRRLTILGAGRHRSSDLVHLDMSGEKRLPSWCGHCPPKTVTESSKTLYPNQVVKLAEQLSFEQTVLSGDQLARRDHWAESFEEIQIPQCIAVETCRFSQRPHPSFGQFTNAEISRLDLKVLQQRGKLPLLKEEVLKNIAIEDVAEREDVKRQHYENLESATVRIILMKEPQQRSAQDITLMKKYMADHTFFKKLSQNVLQSIAEKLAVMAVYNVHDILFTEGKNANAIHIVIRGSVYLQCASQTHTMMDQVCGEGDVLGAESIPEDESVLVAHPHAGPFAYTGTSVSARVETIFVPAEALHELLRHQALFERMHSLNMLPVNKTKIGDASELFVQSRVTRLGRSVTLHRLFEMRSHPRYMPLFREGEKLPLFKAEIMLLVKGQVQLKQKGVVKGALGIGAVLGEEALRGQSYEHSISVSSPTVKVMSMLAEEYVAQFFTKKEQDKIMRQVKLGFAYHQLSDEAGYQPAMSAFDWRRRLPEPGAREAPMMLLEALKDRERACADRAAVLPEVPRSARLSSGACIERPLSPDNPRSARYERSRAFQEPLALDQASKQASSGSTGSRGRGAIMRRAAAGAGDNRSVHIQCVQRAGPGAGAVAAGAVIQDKPEVPLSLLPSMAGSSGLSKRLAEHAGKISGSCEAGQTPQTSDFGVAMAVDEPTPAFPWTTSPKRFSKITSESGPKLYGPGCQQLLPDDESQLKFFDTKHRPLALRNGGSSGKSGGNKSSPGRKHAEGGVGASTKSTTLAAFLGSRS